MSTRQLPYFYESEIHRGHTGFTLSEITSKHCIQVLRMQVGDQLQLTDGKGLLATATLAIAHKKHSQVIIEDIKVDEPDARVITVAVAPTKNMSRIEWALEKLTEIGITEIVLMTTQRTERTAIKEERLRQILISAMLQSRQVFLPRLSGLIGFGALLDQKRDYSHKWIAHCLEQGNKKQLGTAASGQKHLILIGPEGDFTSDEIALAMGPEYQFEPVTLGGTRLRTETAAMVAGVLLKI